MASTLPDWQKIFNAGQATSTWKTICDRGRRTGIRWTGDEVFAGSQGVLRGLFLDLEQDLKPRLQAASGVRAVSVYADVIRLPRILSLSGIALVLVARRIEAEGVGAITLDYRQGGSARLVLYTSEIVGDIAALAARKTGSPERLPIVAPQSAGVWIGDAEGKTKVEPRTALPVEWLQDRSPAWQMVISAFQMATVLMGSDADVARAMLDFIVRCANNAPDNARFSAEWKELGRGAARLREQGAEGTRVWAREYARQLFRGIPHRERARRFAELEHADKAAREGSPYELVKSTAPRPDPDAIRYVRHGAQTVGTATLNGWKRPVRRVSLSGAEIVLDDLDRTQFRATYSGQEDIEELVIHADTLVIKTGLRFPQADVSIYCRTLYCEGKDAYIDTTPGGEKLRSPLSIDGLDGERAGNIVLHIQRFATTEAAARHFRTCGGPGQDPDEGGFQTSDSVRHLRLVTKNDWDDLFQYANRKIAGTMVDAPRWSDYEKDSVVYVELKLRGKVVGSKGEKAEPGTGGKGLLGGRPGNGGPGGDLESTQDVARYADLSGGLSGTPLGPTPGADGGTPAEACWLFFEEEEEKGIFRLRARREIKKAAKGPSSEAGPLPTEPKGRAGSYRNLARSPGPSTWLTPVNLGVAVQFARDALAAGYPAEAGEFLAPYLEELKDGLPADAPTLILQWLQAARDLAQQSVQNVDPYGNPPGWVPLLSLESAVDVYERIVKSSMQELYTAYYLQRAWDSKADRQAALKSLSQLLSENTKTTQAELAETRDRISPLMSELRQVLHEMEGAEDKLRRVEEEIKREADYLTGDEERKAAVAGALKIVGAVLKAIPLPEPYQAATAGLGTVFDIGGGFVEGASDKAFKDLKKQVDAFAEENTDSLVKLANENLKASLGESSKEIEELQKKAEAANKENGGLRALYGKKLEEHENLMKKEKEIYELKKKALLYGRSSTENRAGLVDQAGDLTKAFQAQRDKMQSELDNGTKDYQGKKDAIDAMQGEIEGKQKALELKKELAAEQKKKNEEKVADGLKKVQAIAGSIESIHTAVGRLIVPSAELNSRWDKAVSTLKTQNPTFQELTRQLAYLAKLKTDVTTRLARLQTELTEQKNQISSNLVTLNELSMQLASSTDALAPEVETYVQTLGQDAHRDLQQFLYYVVKAYEYHTVEPWSGSPQDARKLFDDMRNVLEPTNFKYLFDADPEGEEKRKRLEALLAKPDFNRDGMLSKGDFDLLKVVYEKPLRDMGKQLLKHLLQGGMVKQASFSVTLRAEQLKDLNERIDRNESADVPFDLIRLRQVDQSKERQRIANIKVTKVICRQLGQNLPDSVTFRFTQAGKALIRARGGVYAFEPEGGSSDRATARVSFETFGGNSEKGRWSVEKERAVLSGQALWQPTPTREDNLLSKLLQDPGDQNQIKTLHLSEFRPGVFSDFVLKVEVKPPEARIKLEEIELQIATEGVNAPQNEWLVCATSNVGLTVPFSTSKPDAGGHSGGLGRYIGVFSGPPVQIQVPKVYGSLEHKGWEIDGERIGSDAQSVEVSKSAYVVAIYALAKRASAES